jgi:putative DNA primase/helicase
MSQKHFTKSGPRPITIDTLDEGAGQPPPCSSAVDPLKTVRVAITRIESVSLLELSERYFSLPVLDGEGKPRKQPQSEVIVLVIEHFKRWLNEIRLGARVLNGLPHLYGGTYWKPIDDQDCAGLLGELAERLGYQVVESRIFSFREKLLKQFYSDLAGGIDEKEPGRVLINLHNGTLEFVNGNETMRVFRKTDSLTYQLPFDYDECAICPMFEKYLARVLPDPTSRDVLAEYLGWLFLRDLKLEKVLVLFGDGHNGKSVFFDVVNALLGEQNVSNLGLSSLSKIENRHQLGMSLLNFGSEISDRCDADLFKKLASGEPVEARRLYKDVFTMRNYARLAFNANTLPRDTEHTTGFFRRFLIVPFTETISEIEKDPDLANKIIAAELPGVFNWVMCGLRRLRKARKFSECHAADHALATYRKESDSVAMFLEDEGWHSASDAKVGKDQLYAGYRGYCQSAGCRPLSKNNFGKRLLRQHQINDSKSGACRFWHLLRSDHEE